VSQAIVNSVGTRITAPIVTLKKSANISQTAKVPHRYAQLVAVNIAEVCWDWNFAT
jgi:hypothetical protein